MNSEIFEVWVGTNRIYGELPIVLITYFREQEIVHFAEVFIFLENNPDYFKATRIRGDQSEVPHDLIKFSPEYLKSEAIMYAKNELQTHIDEIYKIKKDPMLGQLENNLNKLNEDQILFYLRKVSVNKGFPLLPDLSMSEGFGEFIKEALKIFDKAFKYEDIKL